MTALVSWLAGGKQESLRLDQELRNEEVWRNRRWKTRSLIPAHSQQGVLHRAAVQVVYLGEDLHFEEEMVRDVITAIKDFCGDQGVRAGFSSVAGSPIIGWL